MPQQINLYSPIFLKREKHFSARMMAYGLAVVAVALAAIYAYGWFEHLGLLRAAQEYETRLVQERARYTEATRWLLSEDARKALESESARLAQEIARRRKLLESLHAGEYGNAEGVSPYFAALARRAIRGVWLTGVAVSEGGGEFVVSGRMLGAELAPVYLRALGEEEVMRGRRITELKLARKNAPAAAPGQPPGAAPIEFVEFSFVALREATDAPRAAAGKEAR
jgi:hypothetical protein